MARYRVGWVYLSDRELADGLVYGLGLLAALCAWYWTASSLADADWSDQHRYVAAGSAALLTLALVVVLRKFLKFTLALALVLGPIWMLLAWLPDHLASRPGAVPAASEDTQPPPNEAAAHTQERRETHRVRSATGPETARYLEQLDRVSAPFSVAMDRTRAKETCGREHGIWSEQPLAECRLPGGRVFRFVFRHGSLNQLTLRHSGASPAPMWTEDVRRQLDSLAGTTQATWQASALPGELVLQRR